MSQPEPDKPDAPALHSGFSKTGLVAILLLIYVLSVPEGLTLSGTIPSGAVKVFYAPLEFLYDHIPAVAKFYDWYFELWGIR